MNALTIAHMNHTPPSPTGTWATESITQRAKPANAEAVVNDIPALLPRDQETDFWVAKISTALGNSAGWLIQTGQHLIQAKAALGHGRWMGMFEAGQLKLVSGWPRC